MRRRRHRPTPLADLNDDIVGEKCGRRESDSEHNRQTKLDERALSFSNLSHSLCHKGGVAAMSIHSFVESRLFEPDAIAVMSEAFEAACEALDDTGQPRVVLEIIAERIIEAASRERDPVRLRKAALPWLHERG
jgi:hypothetical protein